MAGGVWLVVRWLVALFVLSQSAYLSALRDVG